MNRFFKSILMIGALSAPVIGLAADADADVASRLAQLEATIKQQQAELADLRGTVDSQVSRLDGSIASALEQVSYAQTKDAPLLKLGKNTRNLELVGDVRVRWQREERDDNAGTTDSRDRFRQRVRLGFKWMTADDIEVGAGLATGGADPTSTNDTYSDGTFFDTGDIRLDYAYGKKTWANEGDSTSLTLGQMKNPFVSSWLFWDGDIRPVGLVGNYKMANGLYATLGGFEVNNLGRDQASVQMLGTQVGYNGEAGDGKYSANLAYYMTTSSVEDILPAGFDQDFSFDVLDFYADYKQKVSDVDLKLYGDYFVNLGAESSAEKDNNVGYLLGVEGKYQDITLGYAYGHVEAVSMLAGAVAGAGLVPMGDSDLGSTVGGGTDYKAHRVNVGYALTKSLSIGLTVAFAKTLEANEREGTLYQLDTIFTF
jgi:hypothetical protein